MSKFSHTNSNEGEGISQALPTASPSHLHCYIITYQCSGACPWMHLLLVLCGAVRTYLCVCVCV